MDNVDNNMLFTMDNSLIEANENSKEKENGINKLFTYVTILLYNISNLF